MNDNIELLLSLINDPESFWILYDFYLDNNWASVDYNSAPWFLVGLAKRSRCNLRSHSKAGLSMIQTATISLCGSWHRSKNIH